MDYALCCSIGSSYAQSGHWATTKMKNPVYIGMTASASLNYVGQWVMPSIDLTLGVPKKVLLNIYRNDNSSAYTHEYFVGCSDYESDSASVLSTGIQITLTSGEGWKIIDVSGLGEYIAQYESTWYLLIGNPSTRGTYAEIAGYGSGCEVNLDLFYSNGSHIHLASDGNLVAYQIYRAEDGSLVQYNLYRAEDGSLIKY